VIGRSIWVSFPDRECPLALDFRQRDFLQHLPCRDEADVSHLMAASAHPKQIWPTPRIFRSVAHRQLVATAQLAEFLVMAPQPLPGAVTKAGIAGDTK